MTNPAHIAAWRAQVERFETLAGELDERAILGFERAREDKATAAFLERHAGPHWMNLALSAARAYRTPRPDLGAGVSTWEPQDSAGRAWALHVPLLGLDPRRARAWNVVDLLAIDPDGEGHVSTLTGAFEGILGFWQAGLDADAPRKLRLLRSPLTWLREAAKWPNPADADDAQEPVCIVWPDTPDARTVLLHARELIAEDDAHAAALDRRIARLRRDYLPPKPIISVADEQQSEAA
jgi:hypothetical protein